MLVVGIDGVRYDSLLAADTPVLDGLVTTGPFGTGVLLPVQVHEKNFTVSGPVWSTVATGVYMDRHGMVDNDTYPPQMTQLPDFTERLRTARPELNTMIAASWFPIASKVECGPIFSSQGWVNPVNAEVEHTLASWSAADDEVAQYASARLASEDLAAGFVYFGEVDEYAHREGTGQGYQDAIERCDARLGQLLAAIESRPGRAQEDWTVIVVTDHGHLDGGGHGGDHPLERTAWMAASGPSLPQISALDHADIAPQVLSMFEVPAPDLDGIVFGAR